MFYVFMNWIIPLTLLGGIAYLWFKAVQAEAWLEGQKHESDRARNGYRPHDIPDDYDKEWDAEYECFIWRKRRKPETDRERLERQNNDI